MGQPPGKAHNNAVFLPPLALGSPQRFYSPTSDRRSQTSLGTKTLSSLPLLFSHICIRLPSMFPREKKKLFLSGGKTKGRGGKGAVCVHHVVRCKRTRREEREGEKRKADLLLVRSLRPERQTS